ncbi:MAG: glycosyltransferase family 4 protein [Phycisphaerales bacterium]
MRILHISTRLILGGSQENTVLSCEGQANLGHDVHLAFGPIHGPEGSLIDRVTSFRTLPLKAVSIGLRAEAPAAASDAPTAQAPLPTAPPRGITTHEIKDLVRELAPITDFDCYRALKRLIRNLAPDIVHTHSSKAGIIGRAAAWEVGDRQGRIGVVHTIHGPPFHAYESSWRNRLYVESERFAAKRCHRIVSVADAMTRQFLARGIGRPAQYVTVYSGMETEAFLHAAPGESREEVRAALGLDPGDLVIGTVARLAELKGHDDLLDALAPDLSRHPALKLLWVGDGHLRARLEDRVRTLGVSRQVLFTGLMPPQRIPGIMRALDVLAHPSYREGLPRTVPQALLAGTAVVASDTDGTPEIVEDKVTGRLVPTGDPSALREAVLWMLEDEPRRRATAERGRALCAERFSAARMVAELEKVYAACR